jgi:plastocyanin
MRRGGYAWVVASLAAASAGLGGCTLKSSGEDLVQGKKNFISGCGSCHTLARAGTKGTVGPNLDEAFRRPRQDGMKSSTFMGVVERQIENPNINGQTDPQTGKPLTSMPAKIFSGDAARNVAAYVAQAAAVPGKDSGRLASVGGGKAQGTAKEANGTLDIPVVPGGGLAYKFANATASAGQVTITSKNPQSTQHDIAITGNGVNAKGAVVSGGGTSKFTVNLKPGTYTFFCSVDGHRQAGMQGKLTVK